MTSPQSVRDCVLNLAIAVEEMAAALEQYHQAGVSLTNSMEKAMASFRRFVEATPREALDADRRRS